MTRIWICGMFRAPEGAVPEACQPGNVHQDDWRCGWAYEGSADYAEAVERYGHAIRKPRIHQV